MFHCRDIKYAFAAVQFFFSIIKPLTWPYPLVPVVSPKNYELMRSPFPIMGCIKDDILYVMNTWNSTIEPNLVHVDLDNNFHSGGPKFKIDKVYKNPKVFEAMKRDFEILQKNLDADLSIQIDTSLGLHAVELVNLVRQVVGDLFWVDRPELRGLPKKREYVVQNSAIDKAAQSTYAFTQMFISLHANKL